MKVLLDHNVPKSLAKLLDGHVASTARGQGWDKLQNGNLLQAAADAGFTALLTCDANMRYQQSESGLPLRIVVLLARSNRIEDNTPLAPLQLQTLATEGPKVVEIGSRPQR